MLRRPALLITTLAVVAVACGGPGAEDTPVAAPDRTASPSDPASATPGTTAAPTPAGSPGNADAVEALDFVAPDLDGGQVRGADHAGRNVVLWMWAPW